MKLIVDMNLSPCWSDLLSEVGFEAKHWSSLGPVKAADSEIMAYAASNDFVVLPMIWISAPFSPPRAAKSPASSKLDPKT